jgi:hypothetical protein
LIGLEKETLTFAKLGNFGILPIKMNDTVNLLGNLHLKKKIRENHRSKITDLQFNPKSPNHNILATIGSNQVTIYNNDNLGYLGLNHLDLLCNFVNREVEPFQGGVWLFCFILEFDMFLLVGQFHHTWNREWTDIVHIDRRVTGCGSFRCT